jgi:spore germination protein YaaH
MSINKLYINFLLYIFLSLSFMAEAQFTVKPIDKATQGVVRKLEKRATEELRDEVGKQKSTLKNEGRTTVQDIKKLPSRGFGNKKTDIKPSLEELIRDQQVKDKLANTDNKTRFVDLFTQWWMLPSEQQLKIQLNYERMLDSMRQIDSSQYRFPKMVNDNQFVTIFGWHPHFNGKSYKSYNYQLLTAISYYSYDIDPYTGEALDSMVIQDFLGGDDPASGIVPTAHAKDCKVLLSITSHIEDNNSIFLEPGNAQSRQNLIDKLIYLLDTSKADGIEINFENVPALYQDEFYKFVRKLSYNLRGVNPDYSICMSVPAYDPNNIFNLGKLIKDVDFFIIKGYDFQNDPSSATGIVKKPVSPLNFSPASAEEDLRSIVERYLASIGPFHAHRLILSFANYGTLWRTDDKSHELLEYVPYSDIQYNYVLKDTSGLIRLDSNYYVYVWQKFDTINNGRSIIMTELLFDDVESYRHKFRFLQEYGLAGVGIWPLGYDEGFENLWDVIADEFTTIKMPEIAGMEKITEVSQKARRWSPVILTVLLYWAIFAAAGFCMALLNVDARRRMFQSGFFRMLFLGFFSLLILLLGAFFGLFVGKTSMLMVGVIIGAFFAYGITVILYKQKAKAP